MAKKLVSLLCAVAMLVTMVSIAAFSASANEIVLDKSMKSLAEATVTPIYGTSTKYNIASTGTFTDATYGDGFVSESWSNIGQGVNIDYGNYSMEAFEFGGVIGFRNQTAADYVHSVTLTVGAVSVNLSGVADKSYTVTATYKGNALPLLKTDGSEFTTTAWANTGAKYADYQATHAAIMAARGVTSGWFGTVGKWPNTTLPVKIGYANGVLTLYTGSSSKDTWKAVATAELADADFSDANVSIVTTAGKGVWYVHNIQGAYKQLSASEPEPVHGANLVIGESVTPVFLFKEAALGGNAAGDLTATVSVAGKDHTGLALVQDGEIYKVACDFITPDTFDSTITVKLVKTADGSEVDSLTYSVKTYCENKFASGSAELKALLRDILVYGESTRQYLLANDSANLDGHTVPTEAIALIDGMADLPATTYPTEVTAAASSELAGFGLNLTGTVSLYVMPKNDAFDTVVSSYGTVDKIVNTHYVSVSFLDAATPITLTLYKDSAEVGSLELSVGSVIKAYSNAYSGNAVMMNLLDCMGKVAASSYAYNASLGA